MKKLVVLALLVGAVLCAALVAAQDVPAAQQIPRYVVATYPTPVLKTPAFHEVFGGRMKLDHCKGVRPIEFIAMTGTLFTVEDAMADQDTTIYRVTTNDYPFPTTAGYYIDSRFVTAVEVPKDRKPELPPVAEVQRRLTAALQRPYVWGGNFVNGVPRLKELYPQADPLAGVDCSGLLYQATNGFTPRNTSALISYGKAVHVAGLPVEKVAQKLKPLDLIVWNGHVMIVLDEDTIIQSTMGCNSVGGVHSSNLRDTLRRLMMRRKAVDQFPQGSAGARAFVVRRWYSR
jgi:hypothetical protein